MKYRLVVLALALSVAGCGSSPQTHFYTLEPVPGVQLGKRPRAPILVGHVDLPGELDRQSLVTRGSGTAIEVSDQDRWAAPLDELVRRTFASDLRSRLPSATILAEGDPTPKDTRTLSLHVRRFMADESGHVTLDTDWAVQGQAAPATTHHAVVQAAGRGNSADAVTGTMSQALGKLADQVAAEL